MTTLKRIAAIVPGPVVVFVGQWINVLSSTVIADPSWQVAVDRLALGIGTIATIFVSIGFADVPKETSRKRFYAGCFVVIVGLVICWCIWLYLGPPAPGEVAPNPTFWQGLWETTYLITQIALVVTISIGALSIQEDKPRIFWAVVLLALLLAIVVAYFIFFH